MKCLKVPLYNTIYGRCSDTKGLRMKTCMCGRGNLYVTVKSVVCGVQVFLYWINKYLYICIQVIYMAKAIYTKQTIVEETGELVESITIKKDIVSRESFIQTYIEDIGVLLRVSKGQIDFIIACFKLRYVEFGTNELVLTAGRKLAISEVTGLKLSSIYNFLNALKHKNILVERKGSLYFNPRLFFYGSETERVKLFRLTVEYKIAEPEIGEVLVPQKEEDIIFAL